MKVASILAAKGSTVIMVKPTDTVQTLSQLLHEHRIGAAVVSADGQTVDGVISERDIAYRLAEHGASLHALPVSQIMTRKVITCAPSDDVDLIASTMLSRNIRHIPIVTEDRLVGMVSIRDVLKVWVDELQQETALLRGLVNQPDHAMQDR